jgi:hypothetical protein
VITLEMQLFEKSQSGENLGFLKKKFLFAIFFGVAFLRNFAKKKKKKTLIGDGTKKVSVCIFFPGLPDCLSKMCVVMTRYILMLPMHNFFFGSYYVCMSGPKICVWASSIFFSKRLRADKKKYLNQTFVKKIGAKKLLYHLQ